MGCVRVDKITDYIAQPLGKCLKDQDPYVRKTAVICVAKLFDINPSLCEMNGFLEDLVGMIGDANPMVDLPFYRFGFHIIFLKFPLYFRLCPTPLLPCLISLRTMETSTWPLPVLFRSS